MMDDKQAMTAPVCIVLVAHAPLASALKAVAFHVHEDCASDLITLDVDAGWSGEQTMQALEATLLEVTRRPILFLVDALGATPANVVMRWIQASGATAAAVHGVNVPMLWRALAYRQQTLPELLERALQGGSSGIGVVMPPV